jgi:beta-lactam-binding protein with PASTA domain
VLVASDHDQCALSLLVAGAVAGCASIERTTPPTSAAVVPDVVGVAVEQAVRDLETAGLRAQLVDEASVAVDLASCARGVVLRQGDPPGEELVRGTAVDLTVTSCLTSGSPPSS